MEILLNILIVLLIITLVLVAVVMSFLLPLVQGAPWVPSDKKKLKTIVAFANIDERTRAVDLGSGDGRIVARLAAAGAHADGIECNPILNWLARRRIRKAHCAHRASIRTKNLWAADLSSYSVIVVFGIPHMMGRLRDKIIRECAPGTRVISNAFHVPGWEPKKKENSIFLYIR